MFLAASSERSASFVDLDVPAYAWIALIAVLAVMLAIDLFRHRDDHEPSPKEAFRESMTWIACGLAFAGVLFSAFGGDAFGEYLSGYVIEKSLSVDNVFVWSLLFTTMAIPLKFQHRVLFWGIFGALTLRAIFIALGSTLISKFWWILPIFGAFLVLTGIKILRKHGEEEHAKQGDHLSLRALRKIMPVSDQYDGHRFLTKVNGKRAATPLLAALVVVEATDVIFAVDSVPAILAVSNEPFLVFSSNAFAILGLRAMYFLLADAKERFSYLPMALGAILVYVGVKMSISHWYHMNTWVSLAIIIGILAAGIYLSLRKNKQGLNGTTTETKAEVANSHGEPTLTARH